MQQVVLHGPGDVRLEQVPRPEPGPLDAVIEVRACGICGSDLGYIRDGGLPLGSRAPMPLGHELSGVIVEALDASRPDAWDALHALHGTESRYGLRSAGSDVYIEASGAPPAIPAILAHAKRHARVSVVALHHGETPVSFLTVLIKELTIVGAMEYPPDFGEMVRLLARRDLSPMITHRFELARFSEALAAVRDRDTAGKVMIEMDPARAGD